MATLTFLRIGKEIHDELEDFLFDHLMERQPTSLGKVRWKLNKTKNAVFSRIVSWLGLTKII